MSKSYEYHPLSNIFPLMEGEEFERLVADIERNGLLEPIVLFDGKILDGRNRYRACVKLGKRPTFKKYPNRIKPMDYVISENIKRRHLDKGQMALILDEIVKHRVAEREREIEEAKIKRIEQERIRKENEKTKIVLPKQQINIPKPTTYTKEAKKISKEVKVATGYIAEAKRLKEIAEKEPIVKKALEEVKKGTKSLGVAIKAEPVLLEPMLGIEVRVPQDLIGNVAGVITGKRGKVIDIQQKGILTIVIGEVPASETFDLSEVMRGQTAGKAMWNTHFNAWTPAPKSIQATLLADIRKRKGLSPDPPTADEFIDKD